MELSADLMGGEAWTLLLGLRIGDTSISLYKRVPVINNADNDWH